MESIILIEYQKYWYRSVRESSSLPLSEVVARMTSFLLWIDPQKQKQGLCQALSLLKRKATCIQKTWKEAGVKFIRFWFILRWDDATSEEASRGLIASWTVAGMEEVGAGHCVVSEAVQVYGLFVIKAPFSPILILCRILEFLRQSAAEDASKIQRQFIGRQGRVQRRAERREMGARHAAKGPNRLLQN